jgi:very-short-patch-repair endonuclease
MFVTGVSRIARRLPFSPRVDHWPALKVQLLAYGLPMPVPEHRFHPTRKWRFDFAWPELKLALEIEGGLYVKGRHVRGAGAEADCVKYAEALVLGWRVLRVSPGQLRDGKALAWLTALLDPPAP